MLFCLYKKETESLKKLRLLGPWQKLLVIDSGASLTSTKINKAELRQREFVWELYRKTLEEMQSVGGDFAYFTGKILFKLKINSDGKVTSAQIISSSTNQPKFDEEILDLMKTIDFPKSDGKTVVSFPYRFVKTKYPRGYIDTTTGML